MAGLEEDDDENQQRDALDWLYIASRYRCRSRERKLSRVFAELNPPSYNMYILLQSARPLLHRLLLLLPHAVLGRRCLWLLRVPVEHGRLQARS